MYSDTIAGKFTIGILVNVYIFSLLNDNFLNEGKGSTSGNFELQSTRMIV